MINLQKSMKLQAMRYKSKHNLLRWFLEDHATLPASYVKSCQKFFKEISNKQQATSNKPVDKQS